MSRLVKTRAAALAILVLAAATSAAAAEVAKPNDDPLFSPAFFWMWNDRLDPAALCAQLEDMRAHGLRNVCIHPFQNGLRTWFPTDMEPDYLTDAYLDV
ncbi:MAG: hypothetical protein J6V72_15880, partial [Kiritimatiellae bacterium]|nr:hypothetical protein [Kiritimatiellia bacterium]